MRYRRSTPLVRRQVHTDHSQRRRRAASYTGQTAPPPPTVRLVAGATLEPNAALRSQGSVQHMQCHRGSLLDSSEVVGPGYSTQRTAPPTLEVCISTARRGHDAQYRDAIEVQVQGSHPRLSSLKLQAFPHTRIRPRPRCAAQSEAFASQPASGEHSIRPHRAAQAQAQARPSARPGLHVHACQCHGRVPLSHHHHQQRAICRTRTAPGEEEEEGEEEGMGTQEGGRAWKRGEGRGQKRDEGRGKGEELRGCASVIDSVALPYRLGALDASLKSAVRRPKEPRACTITPRHSRIIRRTRMTIAYMLLKCLLAIYQARRSATQTNARSLRIRRTRLVASRTHVRPRPRPVSTATATERIRTLLGLGSGRSDDASTLGSARGWRGYLWQRRLPVGAA
ncbi:hypothetical protein C8Q77DRAFT_174286 [Trametes polyzona]|nr:hypothetical protein C8Q77DRAFT_174286 [Trametes polyzona]